jgi:nucleotide-binding universal stress UspA family protein
MTSSIVVGYDGSREADAAIDAAVVLARACNAEITVVSGEDRPAEWKHQTYKGMPFEVEEWVAAWQREAAEDLQRAAERIRSLGVTAVTTCCTRDHPVDLMLDTAARIGASFIVVGATGAGTLHDVVMGSTTMRLLHLSEIPVLVVPLVA